MPPGKMATTRSKAEAKARLQTRLITYWNLAVSKKDELEDLLDKKCPDAEKVMDVLDGTQRAIEQYRSIAIELEELLEDDELGAHITTVETQAGQLENLLRRGRNMVTEDTKTVVVASTSNPTAYDSSMVKLKLPRFDGKPENWRYFYEMYRTLVYEEKRFSDVIKLSHLTEALDGEAKEAFGRAAVTGLSLEETLDRMKRRYGDSTMLLAMHITALISMEAVPEDAPVEASRTALNDFLNHLQEVRGIFREVGNDGSRRALSESMKKELEKERELFLTPLLLAKFKKSVSQEWYRRTPDVKTRYSFPAVLEFVSREVEIEEHLSRSRLDMPSESVPKSAITFTAQQQQASKKPRQFAEPSCAQCGERSHSLPSCDSFQRLNVSDRWVTVRKARVCWKCLKRGHQAHDRKCRGKPCGKCDARHHSLLHEEKREVSCDNGKASTFAVSSKSSNSNVLLQSAQGLLWSSSGKRVHVRIMLDPGSTVSYIREDVARELGLAVLESRKTRTIVFGGDVKEVKRSRVMAKITDLSGNRQLEVQLWTTPMITDPLPSVELPEVVGQFGPFCEDYSRARDVQVLIGSDRYWDFLVAPVTRVGHLMVLDTILGRIVTGQSTEVAMPCMFQTLLVKELEDTWSLEAVGVKAAELESSLDLPKPRRSADGRCEVDLPWKNDIRPSGNGKVAHARFRSLVGKMNEDQSRQYFDYMDNWEAEGIVHRTSGQVQGDDYYLPHRGVWARDKLRVVVDGSAPGKDGRSINDHLHTGPNLVPKIPEVITAFRLHRVPVRNDITKAFLQVRIAERDRRYLRLIWQERNQSSGEPNKVVLEFDRLPFGLNSSPWLLQASLGHVIGTASDTPGWVLEKMKTSIYVDDLVASVSNESEKVRFMDESEKLLNGAGFKLKKWDDSSTVLGLDYDQGSDTLSVKVKFEDTGLDGITKRKALSVVSSVFDPLGFLSPWVLTGRLICQEAWKSKGGWDALLSPELFQRLQAWMAVGTGLIKVPRWVQLGEDSQLHVFVDASEVAYAACVYLVGDQSSHLLMSRFRVAPIKPKMSIPRLELMSALVGARLYEFLRNIDALGRLRVEFWTDSEVVRHWLKSGPAVLRTFESNRVREIVEKTRRFWRRVPTHLNPADLATRGKGFGEVQTRFWWSGPEFLR